ncbi:MAG TPA: hypothetical protein VF796_05645 [Humisphaera sp.]
MAGEFPCDCARDFPMDVVDVRRLAACPVCGQKRNPSAAGPAGPQGSPEPLGPAEPCHPAALYVWLAAAWLIGVACPTEASYASGTRRHTVPNLLALVDPYTSLPQRLFLGIPLVAAPAALVVAIRRRGIWRGVAAAACGLLPFVIVLVSARAWAAVGLDPFGGIGDADSDARWTASTGLAAIGATAMAAAALGLRLRPRYRPLSVLAACGAAVFLAYLLLPVGDGMTSAPLLAVLDPVGSTPNAAAVSVLRVLAVPPWLVAVGLSFGLGVADWFTPGRAAAVLWAIGLAVAAAVAGAFLAVGGTWGYVVLAKAGLMLGCPLALVPVGLSEVLLGVAARDEASSADRAFEVRPGRG